MPTQGNCSGVKNKETNQHKKGLNTDLKMKEILAMSVEQIWRSKETKLLENTGSSYQYFRTEAFANER